MKLGELISSLFINLQGLIKNNIKIKGKSLPKIVALCLIPSDGMEMSMLSKRLGLDNSTVTRLVEQLEKNGWARREPSIEDKRVVLVSLTKNGLKIQRDLEKQFESVGDKIEKNIGIPKKLEVVESITILNWILLKSLMNKK